MAGGDRQGGVGGRARTADKEPGVTLWMEGLSKAESCRRRVCGRLRWMRSSRKEIKRGLEQGWRAESGFGVVFL